MKKIIYILTITVLGFTKISANSKFYTTEYETAVTFPAAYAIGDYIEFLKVNPLDVAASGYYQISISYTRGGVAAAAIHLASISHSNPALWRETGRINNNPYSGLGVNFTIDCNTEYNNPRFRIRAINTLGISADLIVHIKVTSLNINGTFTALNTTGNDLTVSKFLPMTSDWNLYVGNVFSNAGAQIAIKATQNGYVGIGTTIPDEKLTVDGKIHAKEVRVDLLSPMTVPDYVFTTDYKLKTLKEVEEYIKKNNHLPEIPSAKEIEKNGLMLAEMNMSLLKKIEELTLYSIEQNKKIEAQTKEIESLKNLVLRVTKIENELARK
ncbi:hypothetical protein D0817_05135 [Flavobacterium cupreum]|uniref:Cell wall anchor protein n=2 Tax=Flavobacterium TaxID=237 RepID=A0A434AA88_9FLAO|nr:tail fiber protein [Flavobacterium cupreum]RUT71267.1 hypothetical protein D0817_05135 [Flavobacterium cupreum]